MKDSFGSTLIVDRVVQDAIVAQSIRIDFAVMELLGFRRK
jgi:hypothetical protein